MREIYLERNWWILWYIGTPLALFFIYLCYRLTVDSIQSSSIAIILANTMLIVSISGMLLIMWFELTTVFTDEGIKQKGFLGNNFIYWKDILVVTEQNAFNQLQIIDIQTKDKTLRINALYYKDTKALTSIIRSQTESNKLRQNFN